MKTEVMLLNSESLKSRHDSNKEEKKHVDKVY